MRDDLLIAVIVACCLIALRRPVFGMLTFVWLGFLSPHSMTWAGRTFPVAQLTGAGTILGYLFWSEPRRFPAQRESLLLLALWGTFGISSLFALEPDSAYDRFIDVSKILLMALLSTSLINTRGRIQWLVRVIALSLGFYGLKGGLFVLATGGNYLVWGPEESFLYANTSIGIALAMNVPLLLYLSKIETHAWVRWLMRAMLALSYPAVIFTYSRGAWVALACLTVVMFLQSTRKFRIVAVAILLGIIALPSLPQLLPQRVVNRYEDLVNYTEETSAESRLWNWEFCRRVGLARPFIGGGFRFHTLEVRERYYPEFIEYWMARLGRIPLWSCHSMWFTILGEHGVPAFILWIILMGSCFLSLRSIRSAGKTRAELSWTVPYADMLQASFVGFVVGGTFLDIAYFDMFYFLVAVLIIIKDQIRHAAVGTPPMATVPVAHG